jgi:glutathione S-transferase
VPSTLLVTIPFSHYCEKARWALDRCGVPYEEEGHLPIFHARHARRVAGGHSVPALRAGDVRLPDSTDIVAWADGHRPGALLPADPAARAEALALEDELDRQLGPATRRWAYFHLLPDRSAAARLARGVPRLEYLGFRAVRPLAVAMMRRGLKIDAAGAARSQAKIDEAFAKIAARLADGRRYLVGGAFSVADLSFAALATPVLLPPEQPLAAGTIEDYPAAAQPQLAIWRQHPAAAFVRRIYQEERAARA